MRVQDGAQTVQRHRACPHAHGAGPASRARGLSPSRRLRLHSLRRSAREVRVTGLNRWPEPLGSGRRIPQASPASTRGVWLPGLRLGHQPPLQCPWRGGSLWGGSHGAGVLETGGVGAQATPRSTCTRPRLAPLVAFSGPRLLWSCPP